MITVLNPGIYSTIQDLGRPGFTHIGVPLSGVMDAYSANIGNQLLNNKSGAAVVEITFGSSRFQFEKEMIVCLTGGNFTPKVDGENVEMNSVLKISKNSILSFGKKEYGARIYLCVSGGFKAKITLGSKSFYKEITANTHLKKSDQLLVELNKFEEKKSHSKIKIESSHFLTKVVFCLKGPEFELLSERQQRQLLNNRFTVSNDNNRVGYRLEELIENDLKSILTSGVLPGTVQLTPSGKLIVLMRDCQVTGGYPRVLQLTEESINVLAQKSTSDKVEFVLK